MATSCVFDSECASKLCSSLSELIFPGKSDIVTSHFKMNYRCSLLFRNLEDQDLHSTKNLVSLCRQEARKAARFYMFKMFLDLDGKIGRVYMNACLEEKKV